MSSITLHPRSQSGSHPLETFVHRLSAISQFFPCRVLCGPGQACDNPATFIELAGWNPFFTVQGLIISKKRLTPSHKLVPPDAYNQHCIFQRCRFQIFGLVCYSRTNSHACCRPSIASTSWVPLTSPNLPMSPSFAHLCVPLSRNSCMVDVMPKFFA